jgi:catechol 2,3-dioxygenase-like lactoylglutathione lyase family enzyme
VSGVAKSTQFYTDVVGCRHLSTTPNGQMVFLDAAGTCLILVKRDPPPINPVLDDHGGEHHSFAVANEEYKAALDHLRAHGVETPLRRTGKMACSTAPAPIFSIPTVRC